MQFLEHLTEARWTSVRAPLRAIPEDVRCPGGRLPQVRRKGAAPDRNRRGGHLQGFRIPLDRLPRSAPELRAR
jgi:hypothetical protein